MKKSVVELVVSVLLFSLGFLGMGLTALFRVVSIALRESYSYTFLSYLKDYHISWLFVLSFGLFLLGAGLLIHCWLSSAALYKMQEKREEELGAKEELEKEERIAAMKSEAAKLLIGLVGLILAVMIILFIFIMNANFS